MQKIYHTLSIFGLMISAIMLVALQIKPLGWLPLALGAFVTMALGEKQFRKDIILLYLSLTLLGIAPISTDLSTDHILKMGIPLLLAVIIPYLISKYLYKENLIHFSFTPTEKKWQRKEILYVLFTGTVIYLLLPILLRITGSYHNWIVKFDFLFLAYFFIWINIVGAYDEIIFMGTFLKILKNYFPFFVANTTQSIIFTSFLYELGFRGWLVLTIFVFAFLQGRVFYKTGSLFYLITIHLTADLILFFALIHAYYPQILPIFLIK
ncbi:MAG TPA: CPBP family intramembrane glutamic endopeptidase [Patescibacteria group bacterium]